MEVHVNTKTPSLAEALRQAREMSFAYRLLDCWIRLDQGKPRIVPKGKLAEMIATPCLFVTACAPDGGPINDMMPEPREMEGVLRKKYGWQKIRHGVYAKLLGEMKS
jgi:hypothetical protein